MNTERFYTYPVAYETKTYQNAGGGITVEQDAGYESEPQMIILTTDQARWLAQRLQSLMELQEEDAKSGNGGDNA